MTRPYDELSVFAGNANPALAQAVCDYIGIPLGQLDLFEFSNENIFVRIRESVRAACLLTSRFFASALRAHLR